MQDPTIYMRELFFNAGSYNIYEKIITAVFSKPSFTESLKFGIVG